ncbi:MAG: VWA domain-containing protein [Spirochaetales bacterium]|nr:VWA domain-containing protein [Spirochaetales bacterium]MCF7938148.1 VWA domain-containing protein [Spirochaetales bacterium]
MLTFDYPGFLLLLFLLPVLIYFRHFWPHRGGVLVFPFRLWGGEGFKPAQRGVKIVLFASAFCMWTGLALLIVALSGPALSSRERSYLSRGIDFMIVLDESPSMSARDFPPENRFQSAVAVIQSFIDSRENDPIGLVSFSKEAALRVPPTLDYEVVKQRLESLQIMSLGDGTAIGKGLALAALHLRNSSADAKNIILLTDGEQNAGEISPDTAVRIAEQLGIRIYTIGIGTPGDVPLEFTDPETGGVYRGTYHSEFDEELLQKLAEETGGAYFAAAGPATLQMVFNSIDSIESTEKRMRINVIKNTIHRHFIFAGFLLVLGSMLIRKLFLREAL